MSSWVGEAPRKGAWAAPFICDGEGPDWVDLHIPSEQFTSLSDGSVRSRADAAVIPVAGRPPSRVGAANFHHFRWRRSLAPMFWPQLSLPLALAGFAT
jgi:hypothetical protein